MKERDYLKMKAQLAEKHRGENAALDLLWKSMGQRESAGGKNSSSKDSHWGDLTKRVDDVLAVITGEFKASDISKHLPNERSTSIANTLNRFVRQKKITLVRQGKDRWTPTVYSIKHKADST